MAHDDDAAVPPTSPASTSPASTDAPFAHASVLSVRSHFDALVALSEASVALRRARDCLLIVDGETLAGAVAHVLADATQGLATELGQVLAAEGEQARDPEVRRFVALLRARLHGGPPAPVPPDDAPRSRG